MTGYHTTNRGRYKCDFCDQRSYKTLSGINTHVQSNHELELERATSEGLRKELERERRKAPKIVERERVVYKDKPDPKYWNHGVYCTACRIAYRSVGVPFGQTIESTPHSNCGTKSLLPVNEVVL
jgi:hypothetical protein